MRPAADLGLAANRRALRHGDRRAFTLVELLVVIGLVMLLMGLTVAGVVRQPRVDRMVGAEQALGDAIRQARHTARTSGQPVILRLKAGERAISGLLRQPLWQGLEGWPKVGPAATAEAKPGRTGTGLMLPEAYCTGGDPAAGFDNAAMLLPGMETQPLALGQRLWRGSVTLRPPLMLSLAVNPPIAGETSSPDIVPLVMVGPEAAPDPAAGSDFASYDKSLMGLLLIRSTYAAGGAVGTAVAPSWEILAWVGNGASRLEVSSIVNVPTDMVANNGKQDGLVLIKGRATTVTSTAESWPLIGGHWTEINLLFDGDRKIVLYRDGRRIAEATAGASVAIDESTAPTQRVYVGMAKIPGISPSGTPHPAGGPGSLQCAALASIDDVRVERLGDAMVGSLSQGVFVGPVGTSFDVSRRIICHPDGRVEVQWESASNHPADPPNPLLLSDADGGTSASLDIDATGTMTKSAVVVP